MDQQRQSGLKFYSLGIVLKDKALDDVVIEVDPIEDFVLDDGKIVNDDRKFNVTLPDHKGKTKTSKVTGGSMIKAKWIPFGNSNRDTAPDVRKNETVMIFRFADEQEYYWDTCMREPEIRRLERVRYSYSNKPGGLDPYDDDSSYWLEYSTTDQHIWLHTSDNNGEPCKYDIKIDTKAGTIDIKDDVGNEIKLDSVAGVLETTTTKQVIFNTPEFVVNTERFLINASEKVQFETPKFLVEASEITKFTTPKFEMEGTDFEVKGNQKITKNLEVGENVEVGENIHASGTIIDERGNTNHHGH